MPRRRNYRRRFRPRRRVNYNRGAKSYASRNLYTGGIPRTIGTRRHFFKQTYFPSATAFTKTGGGNYSASNGMLQGPTGTADMGFSLLILAADLPQFASFAALFDAYKISKVVVKFVPQTNSLTSSSNAASPPITVTAQQQFLTTVLDFDDATNPSSLSELMEYESYRQTPSYKMHKRVFRPKISQQVYKASGTTIAYSQSGPKWLDAAYSDVEHYGLKGYIPYNGGAIIQQFWRVTVTAYISFKQVR